LLFFLVKQKKEQEMTEQVFSYQTGYPINWNSIQGFQNNSELIFQFDPFRSGQPSAPSPKPPPLEPLAVRKEHQRRLALDHILQKFSDSDLPGKEHALNFLQHKYRRNWKRCSLESSGTAVRFFLTLLKTSNRTLEDISRADIEAFVEYEQDRGMSIRSVRNRMHSVYCFARFLIENQIIGPDILEKKLKVKLPVSLPRAIDPEDLKALLSVIDHTRNRAMILLLLRTGMRIGELLDLHVTDVNLAEKKVLIYMGEKNYRGRVVYFSEDAEEALKAWLETRDRQNEMLFYGRGRSTITYATVRVKFKEYLDLAGLSHKKYSLHCLRHTFATELLNAGLRLEVLQQLLGHSNLEITRQYARLSDKTREDEYFRAMAIIERGERNGHY
jgi:integrase/recombinase XerD